MFKKNLKENFIIFERVNDYAARGARENEHHFVFVRE